jgi:hypothetical protein
VRTPYLAVLVAAAALGHPRFGVREEAQKVLQKFRGRPDGWKVWYVLESVRRQTPDPEVGERCRRVMGTR